MRVSSSRDWLLRGLSAVLVLSMVLAPAAGFAQDDDEDDFLSDDYGEEDEDDFLTDAYAEDEAEEAQERDFTFWAVYVPTDLLLSRPFALNDTVIGTAFYVVAAPILGLAAGSKASWEYIKGEGWYFDRGNLQWAYQACVTDPFDYLWNRPLGQLSSEY